MMHKFLKTLSWLTFIASCGMNNKGSFLVNGGDDKALAKDVLRGLHFRVYAYQVNTFFKMKITILIHSILCTYVMQYPPLMYGVKDSNGNVSSYEGFTVQFINYLAQHFKLMYLYNDIV